MDRTANLDLGLLQPAQASKHIIVNESFLSLDTACQLRLSGRDLDEPPQNHAIGQTYATSSSPLGDWLGQPHSLAVDLGTQWWFIPLQTGFSGIDLGQLEHIVWSGSAWLASALFPERVDTLGIGADAATGQALTVEGDSALFNASQADFRQTLNRSGTSDIASVLFQTGFSAGVELGLIGSDAFTLRCFDTQGNPSDHLSATASHPGIKSDAFQSGDIFIANGDIGEIATPKGSGIVAIVSQDNNYPQVFLSGFFAFDAGVSPSLLSLALQTGLSNQGTVDLTQTAGPAGKVSLSAQTGKLQIGNEYQFDQSFAFTFLS